MTTPHLQLTEFSVSFGQRRVLDKIDLSIAPGQLVALMGPGSAGKSTLVRTICGLNDVLSYMTTSGQCRYAGKNESDRPALVSQKLQMPMQTAMRWLTDNIPARGEMTQLEQRALLEETLTELGQATLIPDLDTQLVDLPTRARRLFAIVRATLTSPALICIDEPAAGLEEEDAAPILELLERLTTHHSVLLVTHNQQRARRVAHSVALLVEGTLIEHLSTSDFFNAPTSELTRIYTRTGSCSLPAAPPRHEPIPEPAPPKPPPAHTEAHNKLELELLLAPRPSWPSEAVGPRGFKWLTRGKLAGCPKPGLLRELQTDLDALARVGVDLLVTLTEEPLPPSQAHHKPRTLFFPIVDMRAPELEPTLELCEHIASLLTKQTCVAFHCKAGLGRTGTMLAAVLIWHGDTATDALTRLRRVERCWVQSTEQEDFLHELEAHLHQFANDGEHPRPTRATTTP